MIKLERYEVMNFENAMRGARNPLNSWARMDSKTENGVFTFGPNDLDLAKRLCKAGSDHRKFIRQIFVTVDITAPIYWWKEYDTYKVGTVANSTSTMHKIHSKPFEMSDFSVDHCTEAALDMMQKNIDIQEEIISLLNGIHFVTGLWNFHISRSFLFRMKTNRHDFLKKKGYI